LNIESEVAQRLKNQGFILRIVFDEQNVGACFSCGFHAEGQIKYSIPALAPET
jgi:hypothetical protein